MIRNESFAGIGHAIRLVRYCGPVLGMELRLQSRRPRAYLMRLAFLAALVLYVAMVWTDTVDRSAMAPLTYKVSAMSQVGAKIASNILSFQFLMGQFMAIFLMSFAFNEELYHRRLPGLMATPLKLSHLMMGKYLSRMIQPVIVLLIALPAVSIVRVFGGVPWGMVMMGLGMSLLGAAAAGATAMHISFVFRQPIVTMLYSMLIMAAVDVPALSWLNYNTSAAWGAGQAWTYWLIICGVLLAVALVMLIRANQSFYNVAMRSVGNEPDKPGKKPYATFAYMPTGVRLGEWGMPGMDPPPSSEKLLADRIGWADIQGSPIVWRAMRGRLAGLLRTRMLLVALLMCYIYFAAYTADGLEKPLFHLFVIDSVFAVGAVLLAVLAGASITSEKEAGIWPVLLATPMTDADILWAKLSVLLQRCWPGAAGLGAHLLIFTLTGAIHPMVTLQVIMLAATSAVFLIGLGICCSTFCRRNFTAVTLTIAVAGGLWLLVPTLGWVMGNILSSLGRTDSAEWLYFLSVTSPFMQPGIILRGRSPLVGPTSEFAFVFWAILCDFAYAAVGIILGWVALSSFRRRAFA